MTSYRIFLLGLDGRLQAPLVVECAGDADAILHLANSARPYPGSELWDGGRPVAHIGPDGEAKAGLPVSPGAPGTASG